MQWKTLTLTNGFLVCKIFFNGLRIKSLDSKTMKGHQAVEGPFRISMGFINMLQMKLVQIWMSNSCTNIRED